jgi:PBP1b-binding outer membrane lipoprotein LpoB
MNKMVAAMVAALVLAGCATSQQKVDPATVASFQPGVTTIAQVESALGQPFQSTRMPDGGQQLQYINKYQEVAGDGTPTTGSHVPKRVEKTVSTVLSFDASGHFVSASSNSKSKDNQGPSDLGHLNGGDVQRQGGQ